MRKILLIWIFSYALSTLASESKKEAPPKFHLNHANLFEIQYPFNAAILQEVWAPQGDIPSNSQKIILYIQDAHCQFEAQTNISKLLEKLIRTYGIQLVAVEGTDGLIDTTPLAEFKDEEVKEMVVKYFMRRGKITGPEYLSIMKKRTFTLFGIEESKLYDANLMVFKKLLPFREKSQTLCQTLEIALNQLKKPIFSKALIQMDRNISKYNTGQLSLSKFCFYLKNFAGANPLKEKYPNFFGLLDSFQFEQQMNTPQLETEQKQLMQKLSRTFSKDKLSQLITASLEVRLGKVSQTQYYLVLNKILEDNLKNIPNLAHWKTTYPEVSKYIQYSQIYAAINQKKAFQEIDALTENILDKLFKNEDERTLFYLSKHVKILNKLFLLELSRKDLTYFRNHRNEFKINKFLDFIESKAKSYPVSNLEDIRGLPMKELQDLQADALNFYRLATQRDKILLRNTLKAMEQSKSRVAVMITGGYHMEGIKKQLKKHDIAYAILFPKITHDQPDNPYIEVLSQQKSAFEEFIHRVEELD